MVDWFSPSVRHWWLLQALPDFISCLFTCSDVECLFRIMNNKWLLLKILSIYCFYLKTNKKQQQQTLIFSTELFSVSENVHAPLKSLF